MAEIKCPHCGTEHVHKCGKLPSGKQRYLCNECKKGFSTGNAVVKQALDEHCPYCGGELRYRGYNDSGSRRYRCKECGRSCSGTTLLKPRQVNKEGVKCPYCGSLHIKKGGVLKSGAKRYVCNDCSKGFSENTVVREQVKIVCPDCGGACTRSGHNEEGEQRYKCKSCGKKFLENPQKRYETHEKTCPRCEHKFAKKAGKTNGKQYYLCLNCNHKFLEDQQYRQLLDWEKRYIIKCGIKGYSNKQIAEKIKCSDRTVSNALKNYAQKERLTAEQKELLIKFGVKLAIPIEYLHPYIPCTARTCKKFLSKYNIVKPKQRKLTDLEIAQDKFELDRFIR